MKGGRRRNTAWRLFVSRGHAHAPAPTMESPPEPSSARARGPVPSWPLTSNPPAAPAAPQGPATVKRTSSMAEIDRLPTMPEDHVVQQGPAAASHEELATSPILQDPSPQTGDVGLKPAGDPYPAPILRGRGSRSLRPDSGLASMNSAFLPGQEPTAPVDARIRIQESDLAAAGPGSRPMSSATNQIVRTATSATDTRSIGGKSIGNRSLGGRSIAPSMLSPEDEVMSLKVRSLYDSGIGMDTYSQFGEGSRKRVSSIMEERLTERGLATKRGYRNSFAEGTLTVAEDGRKHERRRSESDGDRAALEVVENGESRASVLDSPQGAKAGDGLGSGIENDTTDLPSVSVDRYGFVNHEYVTSSAIAPDDRPFTAPKRVATTLFMESNQPRRKRPHALGNLHFHRSAPEMLQTPLPAQTKAMKDKESSRARKWREMAVLRKQSERGLEGGKGAGIEWSFVTRDPKLISRTWKGIPDCWRAAAWHAFLTASAKRRGIGKNDAELVEIYSVRPKTYLPDGIVLT